MIPRRTPLARKTPLRQVSDRRAAKAGKPHPQPKSTGPDRATRELVLKRDSGCIVCGAGPYGLQVHHRKPRRMGGRAGPEINSPANLVSLCEDHHERVESRRAAAHDLGLLVRECDDPKQVPVMIRHLGLVWLTDDGEVSYSPPTPQGDAA